MGTAVLLLLPVLTAARALSVPVTVPEEEGICLPIIMYHEVKPCKACKDAILPEELEEDLRYLAREGYHPVTMTQVIDYVYSGAELPENPIVLSFDDGYRNNYQYVLPLLQKFQVQIVLSIIGKSTMDFSKYPCSDCEYAYVTWDQLNEMLDTGLVEVQNHTYDLHEYSLRGRIGCTRMAGETEEEYEKLLMGDIGGLQQLIAQNTGRTPNTFAYPYGKRSETTDAVLKKMGFQATLTCDYGVSILTRDPECLFGLKRICRPHGQSLEKTIWKGYETLKYRNDS